MTTSTPQLDGIYRQLLDTSRQACVIEQYAVAYHALAAGMHCARELKSSTLLHEVLQEAQSQRSELNTRHPEHLLSFPSASARGHADVYHSLMRQIETNITQLNAENELLKLQKEKRPYQIP